MINFCKRFMAERSGATAVEYAVLCALIAVMMIGAVGSVTGAIESAFAKVANAQPVG